MEKINFLRRERKRTEKIKNLAFQGTSKIKISDGENSWNRENKYIERKPQSFKTG